MINSKKEYEDGLYRINKLWGSKAETQKGIELNKFLQEVKEYELRCLKLILPDPILTIRYEMLLKGLTPFNLVPYLGSKKLVKEVLFRKRGLTIENLKTLSKHLNIPIIKLIDIG